MSEEQLKAFLEAVKSNESLQERLKVAGDIDAVVKIAEEAGFTISSDELKVAQSNLSELELEAIAGGGDLTGVYAIGLTNVQCKCCKKQS